MINFGRGPLALARDSVHDRSGYEAYALTGIHMRRMNALLRQIRMAGASAAGPLTVCPACVAV